MTDDITKFTQIKGMVVRNQPVLRECGYNKKAESGKRGRMIESGW